MQQFEYSVAGFYLSKNIQSNREVFNFNPSWNFLKKDDSNAYKIDFDDSMHESCNLPHGLELLPANSNSSYQYRGIS